MLAAAWQAAVYDKRASSYGLFRHSLPDYVQHAARD